MAALHNTDIEEELLAQVNELGRASWADVPSRSTGNFFTSDEYLPTMQVDCAKEDWRNHVLNSGYWKSYDAYREAGAQKADWAHLLIWSPSPKRWKFWKWRLFLCIAWWLPKGEVLQGVVYPLFPFRVGLTVSLLATVGISVGWLAHSYV